MGNDLLLRFVVAVPMAWQSCQTALGQPRLALVAPVPATSPDRL